MAGGGNGLSKTELDNTLERFHTAKQDGKMATNTGSTETGLWIYQYHYYCEEEMHSNKYFSVFSLNNIRMNTLGME